MRVIGKMTGNQEKENLSGNLEQNMRETLKMAEEMELVCSSIQKKIQENTILVIGRMERNQEQEYFSLKMGPNKKESLKMIPLSMLHLFLFQIFCFSYF